MGVENVFNKDSVLGVEGRLVLVGGGMDGAWVNTGLKAQIQQALPWLCCSYTHHDLELVCKNAFSSSFRSWDVAPSLQRSHQTTSFKLANIVDDLRCVFEFPKGGHLSVRSHGVRWVTHTHTKSSSAYIRTLWCLHHLSTLTEERSLKPDDRQCLKGVATFNNRPHELDTWPFKTFLDLLLKSADVVYHRLLALLQGTVKVL